MQPLSLSHVAVPLLHDFLKLTCKYKQITSRNVNSLESQHRLTAFQVFSQGLAHALHIESEGFQLIGYTTGICRCYAGFDNLTDYSFRKKLNISKI